MTTSLTEYPTNVEETRDHYASLLDTIPGVEYVHYGPAKGKGLRARESFHEGQVLFTESPVVALQHEDNAEMALACAHCFFHIPEEQDLVSCVHCQDQHYCSPDCRDAAFDQYHVLLCPYVKRQSLPCCSTEDESGGCCSALEEETKEAQSGGCCSALEEETKETQSGGPREEFHSFCLQTNEIFSLVAKVCAQLILLPVRDEKQDKAEPEFAQIIKNFCKCPWDQITAVNAEKDLRPGETVEDYTAVFRQLIGDVTNLFHQVIEQQLEDISISIRPDWKEVITPDVFSNIVGMFELNNISLDIPTLATMDRLSQQEPAEDEQYSDLVFLEGTGLYSIICTMNHSCDPNCVVSFEHGNSRATVRATREIATGEELCITYIDVAQSLEARQEDLTEYQFVCQCRRCVANDSEEEEPDEEEEEEEKSIEEKK